MRQALSVLSVKVIHEYEVRSITEALNALLEREELVEFYRVRLLAAGERVSLVQERYITLSLALIENDAEMDIARLRALAIAYQKLITERTEVA